MPPSIAPSPSVAPALDGWFASASCVESVFALGGAFTFRWGRGRWPLPAVPALLLELDGAPPLPADFAPDSSAPVVAVPPLLVASPAPDVVPLVPVLAGASPSVP